MRALVLVVGALSVVATAVPHMQERTVDDLFESFAADWVRNDPNLATANRYFAGEEQDRLERQLTAVDRPYQLARIARARSGLTALAEFDRASMTDAQRLSAEVLRWRLTTITEEEPFLDYVYPLNQFRGVNITIVDALTVQQPLVTVSDARNFVARLGWAPARMREATVEVRGQAQKGVIPPRFILRATIDQMQRFVGGPAEQNPLIVTLASRLDAMTAVAASERVSLNTEAVRLVDTQVYPAWREAIAVLEDLMPRATDEAGLWRLPNGDAAYAALLRANTTTNLSADEIHRIGLEQVARIEGEAEAILATLGRTQGSLEARFDQLRKEQAYPITDDGRRQIMTDIDAILKDAEGRSRTLFALTPKGVVVAEPFPRFREANAAGQYTAPAANGSRPGTFRIPLRPERMTKFGLRTLVYHETVPGHHYQIALERENASLPRFRRLGLLSMISGGMFPAHTEGWALYAERLAAESGWYDGDPVGRLGQLESELFRAKRLVVDTGLHTKRWTRQQAIAYGIEASEVDRYVVTPGQACAYMIGQLKLIELREKAKRSLGARFSLPELHTLVQRIGRVPMGLLEQEIDRFIRTHP